MNKKRKGIRDKSNKLYEEATELRRRIESELKNEDGDTPFDVSVHVTNIALGYRDLVRILMNEKQ